MANDFFSSVKKVSLKQEQEKEIIKESLFVNIDTAIELMNNVDDDGVGHLVKQREIPILKLAKEYLNEHSISK